MKNNLLNIMGHVFAATFVFTSLGCSAGYEAHYDEAEDLAHVEEAIGEETCGTIAPDTTTNSLTATSPRTYSHSGCFKAFIVEAPSFNGGSWQHPEVSFADTMPTTKTDCESLYVSGYVYDGD